MPNAGLPLMAVLIVTSGCVGLDRVPQKGNPTRDSGVAAATLGALSMSASEFAFGDVGVGTTASSDTTLTNTGDGPLHVDGTLAGEDAFSTTFTALDLEGGGTSVLTVDFAPDQTRDYVATLTLAIDGGDSLDLPVSGAGTEGGEDTDTGTEPSDDGDIAVKGTSMAFGKIDLESDQTMTLEVSNMGKADLLVSDAITTDPAFSISGDFASSRVLAPGDRKTLTVTFTPTAEKSYTAKATLTTDDPDEGRVDIALTGEGVNLCDICSPLIDVDTGGSDPYSITDFNTLLGPDKRTITIQNVGDKDLNVSDVSVNNDFISTCGTFTLGGWTGAKTVKPYGTTTFNVTYSTTSGCLDVAQQSLDANVIHILSNDPGEPDYVIGIGGLGF